MALVDIIVNKAALFLIIVNVLKKTFPVYSTINIGHYQELNANKLNQYYIALQNIKYSK